MNIPVDIRVVQRYMAKQGIARSVSDAYKNAIARGRMTYPKKETKYKRRKYINTRLRFEIFRRDGYKCVICGTTAEYDRLEIDHINNVPTDNNLENLRLLCQTCNIGKELDRRKTSVVLPPDSSSTPRADSRFSSHFIVFCDRCDDVQPLGTDRFGDHCGKCFIPTSLMGPKA